MANSAFQQKQTGNASTTAAGSVEIATPAQVAAKTATGETGAPLVVSPADLPESAQVDIQMVAGHDLTAGQFVGISQMTSDSTVGVAIKSLTTVAHGKTTPAIPYDVGEIPVGGSKMVRLCNDSGNIYAVVMTLDSDAQTVSLGSYATIWTGTPVWYVGCKLDTDKFIVFYNNSAAANDVKYRVGTISGTTITLEAEGVLFTAVSTLGTGRAYCAQTATDAGVVFAKAATTTSSRVCAFTVSGTTVTAGTPVSPDSTLQTNTQGRVAAIDANKFVLYSTNTSQLNFQAGTISGTTITLGSPAQSSTTVNNNDAEFVDMISPATDVFVAKYRVSADYRIALIAGTVSGTTITLGTPTGSTIATGLNGGGNLVAVSGTRFYGITGQGSTPRGVAEFSLSGTDISLVGYPLWESTLLSTQRMAKSDDGTWYIYNKTIDATDFQFWLKGSSINSPVIGAVIQSVSSGSPVTVRIKGVVGDQSGLVTAGVYKVGADGALTQQTTAYSNTNAILLDLENFVYAISPTQVLLK